MLNFEESRIDKIISHSIGSKAQEISPCLSNETIDLTGMGDEAEAIFMSCYTKNFKGLEFYSFNESSKIKPFVEDIFFDRTSFVANSKLITERLHDISENPGVKDGDLHVVYISGCIVEDEYVDAVVISKVESKDKFLCVRGSNVEASEGFNLYKLHKGIIIFNTESDLGFKCCMFGKDDSVWQDDFLDVHVRANDFYKTRTFMKTCKDFAETVLTPDNNVTTEERVDFLANTVQYMKEHIEVDIDDYAATVLQSEEAVKGFKAFKADYDEANGVEVESFKVDEKALKGEVKNFKSIIKLDKNFHVYVHANPRLMSFEKEGDGRKFVKLYYEQEVK